jgi:choline monooxygenase
MTSSIFSPEHYAATRLPLHQASPLPGWCYASPEWYAREIDTMFRKDWLCVGRVEQVPEIGSYYSIEVISQPLIVVRDESNQVRVHSALCRHRGAIITEGEGRCRAFSCPYHSWTYGLSGKLTSTPGTPPPMAGVEGFKTSDFGLKAIRSEIWAGFVFITFDNEAEPLTTWLGDLPGYLADYDLGKMQWTKRDTYEVECNWKVWLENAF